MECFSKDSKKKRNSSCPSSAILYISCTVLVHILNKMQCSAERSIFKYVVHGHVVKDLLIPLTVSQELVAILGTCRFSGMYINAVQCDGAVVCLLVSCFGGNWCSSLELTGHWMATVPGCPSHQIWKPVMAGCTQGCCGFEKGKVLSSSFPTLQLSGIDLMGPFLWFFEMGLKFRKNEL